MNTITKYVGRVDRERNYIRQVEETIDNMTVVTLTHACIKMLVKDIAIDMPPDEAVQIYLSARSNRHNNWCDYLTYNTSMEGYKVHDTAIKEFVKDILKRDDIVPADIQDKTPDILTLDVTNSFIYLGDVAVTVATGSTRARKYEKYKPIANYLRKLGYLVKHEDFIVQQDLSNLSGVIHKFVENGFIKKNHAHTHIFKEYSLLCNKIMTDASEFCSNKTQFNHLINEQDKTIKDSTFITEPPESLLDIDTSDYIPRIDEDTLMDMIKTKVDSMDFNEYFTGDIQKSIKAINDLISVNLNRPHCKPKSILKVVDNSHYVENKSGHDLIIDYVEDILEADESPVVQFALHLLPNLKQLSLMKKISDKKITDKKGLKSAEFINSYVYGEYQYKISSSYQSFHIANFGTKLSYGKKLRNEKSEPECINLKFINDYYSNVSSTINYYGSISLKPPILPNTWEAKTKFEEDNTMNEKELYFYTKSTNGAQLCQAMALLYDRITHLSTTLSTKDNIFIPPNGSFVAIIPKEHAPISAKVVDLPFIFITRCPIKESLNHIEYEYTFNSDNYTYYISKLCRLNIEKISNWANAGYKLLSTSTYLLARCPKLQVRKHKVVGVLTMMILDVHQKVSEFLDLLKYISFMPFSDISRLPDLIKDKFDLLVKTKLDAWMIYTLKSFITELSSIPSLNAKKPKIRTFNTNVIPDSLGINLTLPSFIDNDIRHDNPDEFIEEINMIYTVRPKHLYGSQFMDKSITSVCEWNLEHESEIRKFGGWAVDGFDNSDFPFEAKFCYSADVIHYAEKYLQSQYNINRNSVENILSKTVYSSYMHKNCSLRGCTKDKKDRLNHTDIHTTSLDACLKYYKDNSYIDEKCTTTSVAYNFLMSGEVQQYSMSEKDQRGGGRPIATPTLGTKAALMMIEKPEASKGRFMPNNIIVPKKNKLKEQCETYKSAISAGIRLKYKYVYQLTEDQSKYSENDNCNKYEYYIRSNDAVGPKIKAIQLQSLKGLNNREHLFKRMPKGVSGDLDQYKINDSKSLGVKATIGWPQGMLNFMSTNVHCGADLWITMAYNRCYPDNTVYTRGLVHSDDSWVVVCCNHIDDFKRFTLFRLLAKRMFCLKLNEKKLWGSRYLGELVSNYNLNGNVHLSVSKTLANSFANLTYQNWSIDVHNQISSIQQCYRNGAGLGSIILLSTILKQQLIKTYHVKGKQLELLNKLPIDLGGYPDCSAFELAVTGVTCHYKSILEESKMNPKSSVAKMIAKCIDWSVNYMVCKEQTLLDQHSEATKRLYMEALKNEDPRWRLEDYENLCIPSRGDIFKAIKHIMPKSKKLSKTVEHIRSLPFESNGLEMIVSKPLDLQDALGHLKAQTSTMLFELAAERYTQSARRLAMSQAIQSSGKVIRLNNYPAMTFNELYDFIESIKVDDEINLLMISNAFSDDNDLVGCAYDVVHSSEAVLSDKDKRKVINYMPDVQDKFTTVGHLPDVLLYLIDESNRTSYLTKYSSPNVSMSTLKQDSDLITSRFIHYFRYHNVIYACSLIMQQYLSSIKSKLWTQPHLRSDNLQNFLEDLYGKTINSTNNYIIYSTSGNNYVSTHDRDVVQTIYCTRILNKVYDNLFTIVDIQGSTEVEALNKVDHSKLNDNDFLKFAVCEHIICGNRDYLDKYLQASRFNCRFIKAQKYINSRYVGDFHARCTVNDIVLDIIGDRGKFRLIANKPDVSGIMKIMRLFVASNFPYDRYELNGAWGNKDFWRSDIEFSDLYLSFYTTYSSTITDKKGLYSLPLSIQPTLSYFYDKQKDLPDGYILDKSLRVVSSLNGNRTYKVGSITQSFSLPLRNYVVLEGNYLQGLDVQQMFSSGIMEAVILSKIHTIPVSSIEELLIDSGMITSKCVLETYLHLSSRCINHDLGWTNDRDDTTVEIETYTLEETCISTVYNISELAEPEDLSALEQECINPPGRISGKLYHTNNILGEICKAYIGGLTDHRIKSFLHNLMYNRFINDWTISLYRVKQSDPGFIMSIDDLMENADEMVGDQPTIDLFCFIMASDIDLTRYWDHITISSIKEISYTCENSPYIKTLTDDFVRCLNSVLFAQELTPARCLTDI
uniref:RNA-dependent RNA polymerase n=1 Tax=Hubei diptera virus 6 TaxID=1922887 RepID=A0A1L3KPI9_9VIRU|nr:RNA-dependent RNA polymerase [Hubei diptera virus 6]